MTEDPAGSGAGVRVRSENASPCNRPRPPERGARSQHDQHHGGKHDDGDVGRAAEGKVRAEWAALHDEAYPAEHDDDDPRGQQEVTAMS